jgi:hypothetical protein
MRLPDLLRSYSETLDKALALSVPMKWGEDDTYIDAEQPAAIGKVLVRCGLHGDLANSKIGYIYREKMAERGKIRLAQASKVSGKLAHFSGLDFLVEVNWDAWHVMPGDKKIALIDHELSHFGVEDTETGTKNVIIAHDVEEFTAIVRRWGLWKRDVRDFGNAVLAAAQLGLFPDEPSVETKVEAAKAEIREAASGTTNGTQPAKPPRVRRTPLKPVIDGMPVVNPEATIPPTDAAIQKQLEISGYVVPIDRIAKWVSSERDEALAFANDPDGRAAPYCERRDMEQELATSAGD